MSFGQVNTRIIFSSNRKKKTKRSCSLTYICPESVSWRLVQVHSFQFMCEAVPLSPLSPRCPFCPAEPWIPGSPFAPFFPSAPRGPWVPVFPGLPRSPLAPFRPGAPGGSWDTCHVCPHPGLSATITRWTRLNRLPKIVKNKPLVALDSFTRHLAFQTR